MKVAADDVNAGTPPRWWFASVWLALLLLANLITSFASVAALVGFVHPATTTTSLIISFVGTAAQAVCIVAILNWQRWGWRGLLVLAVLGFYVNVMIRHSFVMAVIGVAGVGICYLVLKGGGRSAVWPRLR